MKKSFLPLALICLAFAACTTPTDSDILEVQGYTQVMKTGKDFTDPVHGKGVKFTYGAVSGTEGTNANGVAYHHVFEDGASSVTVNLNIELPAAGVTYVAYLQDSTGARSQKLGTLESIVGDVRHTVKFVTTDDISTMNIIKVRREGRGESALVAEGTMKEPAPAQ